MAPTYLFVQNWVALKILVQRVMSGYMLKSVRVEEGHTQLD